MYNLRGGHNLNESFKMKYFLFIVCFTLLLYQSIDLLNEFMSGKTVTNIRYGIIRNTTLPAITICPSNFDFRKMVKSNINVSILYEKYLKIIENSSLNDKDKLTRYLPAIYSKALEMFFNLKTPSINIKNYILENLTPFMNQRNESILSAWFQSSYYHGENKYDFDHNNNDSYRMISLPMESLIIQFVMNNKQIPFVFKCYTLFSHSHSSWNNIEIDLKTIYITLKLDEHSMAIGSTMMIPIMMHSPNFLPYENYNYVSSGYFYIIRYSQWNIERLGKGFDTDCRYYDPKDYTRSDCIFDCYQDRVKRHCETQDFVGSIMLKRIIYFQQRNLNLSKCVVNRKIQFESLKSCEDQCHDECHFKYYSFTISKFSETNTNQTHFNIEHNEMTDLTIRYIPEMPLLTFICNFGGILGMWLGVSFVGMLENTWKIFRVKILSKISTINIRNKLFITNNINSRRITRTRNANS